MDLPRPDDEEYIQVKREASPSHLVTDIESFSLLLKHKIGKLISTEFESGDYKWKVIVNLDEGDYISVILSMVGTSTLPAGWEVNAIFTFFLYNHITDKYLCFQGKARRFHAINSECGLSKLFTKKSLIEPTNGYIFEDRCVFGAEVFVIKKAPLLVEKVLGLNSSTPYKREWKIAEFSKIKMIWKSVEFSAGGYNWQILMYPNGSGSATGCYVSIFFTCVDAQSFPRGKKLNAGCLFTLRNMLNKENNHSKRATTWFSSTNTRRGWTKFKAAAVVHDSSKGFVVDDSCILEIQLSVHAIQEAPHLTGI